MRGLGRKLLPAALASLLLFASPATRAQTPANTGQHNALQARAALDAMVQALGGEAWLGVKTRTLEGHAAAYFQGKPTGEMTEFRQTSSGPDSSRPDSSWPDSSWPDRDRIELTKRRDVVEFYLGRAGWEVTYKGSTQLPQEQVDDFLRRRDYSIETVVRLWLGDPRTLLIYEGRRMVERHQADQVTVISPRDEAVTVLIDADTYLPLRLSFQWRDPVYHDMDTEAEEYDDYHVIDGVATPFIVTRYENGEIMRQVFLDSVVYNQNLPPDFWSVEAAVRRIRK